jgi:polyisoprenoid-binding protein YceI
MNATQTAVENNASPNESASSEPVIWQIDPAHASVYFSVPHMMVANVRGEFGKVSGVGRVSAALPLLDDAQGHGLRRGALHPAARRSRQSTPFIS